MIGVGVLIVVYAMFPAVEAEVGQLLSMKR
jgi:hypothetical protein